MTKENNPTEQPSRPVNSEQPTINSDPSLGNAKTIRFGSPFTLEGMTVDHRYFIEKELGRGGMGIVYLGRDLRLHEKPVVVKVLLEKSLKDPWVMQKFEQEREALARVDHPGVVAILDTGKLADDKPYIVMQYIDGPSLRETIAAGSEGLDLKQAAAIIKQIGPALHAVHEKKIYHRDLKPENILLQKLSRIDEQVKIVDFGIAKVKDSIIAPSTITGALAAGTVLYMSPEQLHGERITAASDVYSFGVIAYELVTGRRPFKPTTIANLVDMQREGVRVKPADLRPQLTAEADAAILKALAFDHTQRYQSAHEFGKVLASALDEEDPPVVSKRQPTRRLVSAKPRGPQSAAESKTTIEIPRPTSEVRVQLTSPNVERAKTTKVKLLILALVVVSLLSAGYLLVANRKSLLGSAKHPELYIETGHWDDVESLAFSFDGKMLATAGRDFQIKLWDIPTGQEVRAFVGHLSTVAAMALSPDGKLLASLGENEEKIRLWNLATGAELKTFIGPTEARILFSPDSQFLAVASSEGSIRLWNANDGVEVKTFQTDADGENVTWIAFSPDGKMLASIEPGEAIKLWDVPTGNSLRTIPLDQGSDGLVLFSSDGRTFWSFESGAIRQRDVLSGEELSAVTVVTDKPYEKIALSAEARFLASTESPGADFKLFNVATGRESEAPAVSEKGSSIVSMSFSPDGAMLAIGDDVGGVTLWGVANNKKLNTLEGHSFPSLGVAYSPDGKAIASASGDKTVKVWNTSDGGLTVLAGHSDPVSTVAFSPDGRTLASASEDETIKLWDLSTKTELRTLKLSADVEGIAFSPNGATLASVSSDVQLWDIGTGVELRTLSLSDESGFTISFSPDGQLLACGDGQTVKVWNVTTGYELQSLKTHSGKIGSVLFSPDQKTLASSDADGTVKLWNVITGAELKTLGGHTAGVHSLAFSPDGKTLASSSLDKTIRLWDAVTGSELKKIALVSDLPGLIAFSPDGRRLVSGSLTGRTYLWDVSSGNSLSSFIALDENEWVVITSDGRFDGSIRGMRLLHYVQDNKPIPLDRFAEELHTLKLLQHVFASS
jgi:WD40 repeat protein/tRNA A-37 threonylcarbamoyl transferase component Bud32